MVKLGLPSTVAPTQRHRQGVQAVEGSASGLHITSRFNRVLVGGGRGAYERPLGKVSIDVFSVQESNKSNSLAFSDQSNSVVAYSNTIVRLSSMQLLEIRNPAQIGCMFDLFNNILDFEE
jgi:hypothetical protein